MRKWYLWVELDYGDDGRFKTEYFFDSCEERSKWIDEHKDYISDMEFDCVGDDEEV